MKKKFVAVIPARGGSKGVKDKNIKLLDNYPLIYYPIFTALKMKMIDDFVITTDSKKIINISKKYVSSKHIVKRPKALASDKSTDIEYLKHLINYYKKNKSFIPHGWIILRPTTPLRDYKLVDKSVVNFKKSEDATSLISVHEISETPAKMFGINGKYLHGLAPFDPRKEYYTLPRQDFPPAYIGNGYVDIVLTKNIQKDIFYGDRMLSFLTPDTGEVDNENDFVNLQIKINNKNFSKYKIKK